MEGLISEYIEYLSLKKLSKNTIMAYNRDLKKFSKYLKDNNLDVKNVEKKDIEEYLKKMTEINNKEATVARQAATLRSFYNFLFKNSLIKKDPADDIKLPRVKKSIPNVLTTKEIETFLSEPDNKSLKGVRDKAMLEIAYATGMKVSEITNLTVKDINLNDEYVVCGNEFGKRVIPLGKISVEALKTYLEEARPFLIKDDDESLLFVNINGCQLSRQGFWKIIKYYKEKANIDKDITPYVLRHSFATHLLQNGADINAIQNMMGHVDISSTKVYLQFLKDDIAEEYKSAHPRA